MTGAVPAGSQPQPTKAPRSAQTPLRSLFGASGYVCVKEKMTKKKDPPDYPGDDAVLKAFGDALRDVRIEKGLSLEEADAAFQDALKKELHPRLPRALGIVVRQLREKQNMSRAQLSAASGLSARFLGSLERGKASNATITEIVRISFGLNYPITDLVNDIVAMEEKLRSE